MKSCKTKRKDCALQPALFRGAAIGALTLALAGCVSSAPTPVGLISQAQTELEQQATPSLNGDAPPVEIAATPTTPQAPGAPADESISAAVQTSADAAANSNRIAAADAAPAPDGTPVQTNQIAQVETQAAATGEAGNAIPSTATALAPAQTTARNGGGGFFGALFGQNNSPRPAANVAQSGEAERRARAKQRMRQRSNSNTNESVRVASAAQTTQRRTSANGDLPGVKRKDLFGTIFGDSDERANKEAEAVQVASTAGFARISRNGLLRQHEGVRVACFKPSLLRVLKKVERRFGKKVIVTSGYRSPKGNRRAGGARNSRHTYCDAADIQVAGVSKWTLAKYLRTLPERGGVGTYCHTKSVHIDTYKKRDWNWACRKRKRRRG